MQTEKETPSFFPSIEAKDQLSSFNVARKHRESLAFAVRLIDFEVINEKIKQMGMPKEDRSLHFYTFFVMASELQITIGSAKGIASLFYAVDNGLTDTEELLDFLTPYATQDFIIGLRYILSKSKYLKLPGGTLPTLFSEDRIDAQVDLMGAANRKEFGLAKMIDCWDQAQVSQEMTSRLEKTILRLWTTSARKRVHIPNRKSIDKLRSLASEMPNFSEVIDFVIEQSQLCLLSASAGFTLPAMLLGGPPGVGKTFFSQRLSAILGFGDVHMIPCGLDNASFGLGGANPTWSSAKPGRPATILLRSQIANPVVLLDEIDKFTKGVVGNGNGGDPYAALYQLLEPTNAKSFIDQYLQFPTNLSLFNWILTANDKDMIPAPIMDRVMYFSIAAPERAHMEKFIVPSVYRTLLAEREMTSAFSDVLSAPVAALLAQCETPRDIRIILLGAFGRAALRATKASIVASDTEFLADGADNETAFIVPTITLEMGDIDIDSRAEAGPSMGFHAVISKPSGRVMLKTI